MPIEERVRERWRRGRLVGTSEPKDQGRDTTCFAVRGETEREREIIIMKTIKNGFF